MEFVNTFWALVPAIVAIVLALITKEVYSSLFIGILVGALLLTGFDPIGTVDAIISGTFVPTGGTEEDAITPPFFTASLSRASAAVVPCVPQTSSPISSRMRATLSPTAGVGARDRSTTPNGTPRRRDASCATS